MYQADFKEILSNADKKSSIEPIYKKMCEKIGKSESESESESEKAGVVNHETSLIAFHSDNTDHPMESAIRKDLGDNRSSHHPDAKIDDIPIEIKHSNTSHKAFPSDSVAVRRIDKKWYIFTEGPIVANVKKKYKIWIMRADHLYDELDRVINRAPPLFANNVPSKAIQTSTLKRSVAVAEIEKEIATITPGLANAVYNRAVGISRSEAEEKPEMSLRRGVNVNSVRFDIKYGPQSERLLRNLISDILKE